VPGRAAETAHGPFWHVGAALQDVHPAASRLTERLVRITDSAGCRLKPQMMTPELAAAAKGPAEALRFIDIETCGFAGSMVFLIGVMRVGGGEVLFEQFLARDYAEEPAIIARLASSLHHAKVLVTFNGKTFDWPCLVDRANVHRLDLPAEGLTHCDLLHEARRRWRRFVPDCRLVTLERQLCGRARQGDIPGSQIPDAYHQFVRTQHAAALRQILHHNRLDLLTLAELLVLILADELPADL
jgi:uncharacterized protein YprB with RNaseH-like and TPR domain